MACTGKDLVLGIETSCDDTGVAIVTPSGQVLGEALATQVLVLKRRTVISSKHSLEAGLQQAGTRAG